MEEWIKCFYILPTVIYLFIYWAFKYHKQNKFIQKHSLMYVRIIV